MRPSLKPLRQQVIVITGASSGIGLTTARSAAKQGARVVLASRDEAALQTIAADIRAEGGEATAIATDVTDRAQIERLAQVTIETYGRFDTWVNDAGIGIFGRLDEVSEEDHRRIFDVNFWGLVNGTLIAGDYLKAHGGGAIINLGSVVSDIGFPIQGMYSASKHAIKGFTDAYRMEMKADPISVTLIKPAAIDTPFAIHAKNYSDKKADLPPPVYTPADVADAILHAAVHGGRDYYIGGGGKLMSTINKHAPGFVDWFGAAFVPKLSFRDEPTDRPAEGSIYTPVANGNERGDTQNLVMRSAYTKASQHPVGTGLALAVISLGALALARGRGTST